MRISLLAAFLVLLSQLLSAQCVPLANANVGAVTLVSSGGGTGNRSGLAYNPNQDLYYSVNAGNPGYPIETYAGTGGVSIFTSATGFDYRGAWWNPSLNQLEGNGFNAFGIFNQNLDASFNAINGGTTIIPGMNQPNVQSNGNFDAAANEVLYYDNGSIYRYDRATSAALGNYPLVGIPVGLGNIHNFSLIYTGCLGYEIGIFDYINLRIYLFDKATGNISATVQLPAGVPTPPSYGLDYANDLLWLHDATSRTWHSYEIFLPLGCIPPTANITAPASSLCPGDSMILTADTDTSWTYEWEYNGLVVPGENSPTFLATDTGDYRLIVTSGPPCVDTSAVLTISGATPPAIASTAVDTGCLGSSISANISGGAPPYSLMWSSGETVANISGLATGQYILYATDNIGCVGTDTVDILSSGLVTFSPVTVDDALCNGVSDGSISITPGGGTPPYTFIWSNGATTSTNTGLSSGLYTVTVTDDNGCTQENTSIVSSPQNSLSANNVGVDISCFGLTDGIAGITGSGGIPPYTYAWSTGDSSNALSGLSAGTYTATVTDANGCTDDITVVVNEPTAVGVSATGVDASCPTCNDGSATATGSGGTAPYSFSWSNGATGANPTGLSPGTYNLTITDSRGCTEVTTITISSITGLATTKDISTFGLYPNPTKERVFLAGLPIGSSFQLSDVLGRILIEEQTTTAVHTLDLSSFPLGVYSIKVQYENQYFSKQIIKE